MSKAKIFNINKEAKKHYPSIKDSYKKTNNYGALVRPVGTIVKFSRLGSVKMVPNVIYEAIAA